MFSHSHRILKSLHHESGLLSAAAKASDTGYHHAWLRDNVYAALGFHAANDTARLLHTYHGILNVLLRHEGKIDQVIRQKPAHTHLYLHARYNPDTLEEVGDDWGHKQNDAIGAILFGIGTLHQQGIAVLRNHHDYRMVQKLVVYLERISYWNDADNGMWEDAEVVHASSIGACVAGLNAVSGLVTVPKRIIRKGERALAKLLPYESVHHAVDLALLSLIYPYHVVTPLQKTQILCNVEQFLVRERGVIRHPGDWYYYRNGEAEWTFGLPWLAIIFREIGDKAKYYFYLHKTRQAMNEKGELPELYYTNSDEHNENSPLAWAQALYMVAVKKK